MKYFVIILALFVFIGAGCARKTPQSATAPQTAAPKVEDQAHNGVTAENQAVGERVNVPFVQFVTPGYVVIHEDNKGEPGSAIGVSQLFRPNVLTVTVSLQRASKVGETLYAVLHGDNGDGKYDAKTDLPLKDVKGADAVSKFTIVERKK